MVRVRAGLEHRLQVVSYLLISDELWNIAVDVNGGEDEPERQIRNYLSASVMNCEFITTDLSEFEMATCEKRCVASNLNARCASMMKV